MSSGVYFEQAAFEGLASKSKSTQQFEVRLRGLYSSENSSCAGYGAWCKRSPQKTYIANAIAKYSLVKVVPRRPLAADLTNALCKSTKEYYIHMTGTSHGYKWWCDLDDCMIEAYNRQFE